jgi:hypothetical protein
MSRASERDVLGVTLVAGIDEALAAFSSQAEGLAREITSCLAEDRLDALERWGALTRALEEFATARSLASDGRGGEPASVHAEPPTTAVPDEDNAQRLQQECASATTNQRGAATWTRPGAWRDSKPAEVRDVVPTGDFQLESGSDGDSELAQETLAWPTTLSPEAARDALTTWAKRKRFVADDTFAGDLEIIDASIARIQVTRLIETRTVQSTTVPGGPPAISNWFGSSLEVVDVGAPTDFDERRWDFGQQGSVNTQRCTTCVGGRVTCRACAGRGIHPCPPTQRCHSCGGRGTTYASPLAPNAGSAGQRQPCRTCAGRGQVPCRKCRGSGQKMCMWCLGQGSHKCQNCEGTGAVTSFVEGTIVRKQAREELRTPEDPAGIGTLKDNRWPPFQRYIAHSVPDGLPAHASSQLAATLAKSVQGEVLRRVDISVLPITRIMYRRGADSSRDAYIIGPEKTVVVRGVRRVPVNKRLAIIAAIVTLVAATVLALALVLFAH